VESKDNALLEKITSLTESINQLDLDITNAMTKVDRINKNVIQIKNEIETNQQTI
jgi:phage shock protein A